MLNTGPKSDGTICDEEKAVLLEIGKWMKTNSEAVYASYPFEVCHFEGKKKKNGSFKENKKFGKKDFCFTQKPGKIYIFPMGNHLKETVTVKSLRRANEGGIRYKIKNIHILGDKRKLEFTQTEKALKINLNKTINNAVPVCICVEVE